MSRTRPGPMEAPLALARFRMVLRSLSRAVLASSCVAAGAGCAIEAVETAKDAAMPSGDAGGRPDQDAGGRPDRDGGAEPDSKVPVTPEAKWDPIECNSSHAPSVSAPNTTSAVDYLAIYRQYSSLGFADPASMFMTYEVARFASPCSGAATVAECEKQLASITACAGACEPFAIAGSAGTFTRLNSRAELLTLLGDIDAVAEAVLLAVYDGHTVCPGLASDPRDVGGETRSTADGYEIRSTWEACSAGLFHEELSVARDGELSQIAFEELAKSSCVIGRRPMGLCEADDPAGRTRTGAFLAQTARLEAASVYAFETLVRELEAFGAPRNLIEAALEAMKDELEHARDVARLARAYGAETAPPEVRSTSLRSKLEVALDNISEGCVRETYGALVATYQAESATDPRVRVLMAKIAEDETRHARLSWQLQEWLAGELSETENAQVASARSRAITELGSELESGLLPMEAAALGYPAAPAAAQLMAGLRSTLWA